VVWKHRRDGVWTGAVGEASAEFGLVVGPGQRLARPGTHRQVGVDESVDGAPADPGERREVVDPAAVLEAALGVDVGATRAAVAETTAAFVTTEGGSRVDGRVAVPADTGLDPVIEAVIAVLETGYETVARDPDAVVVTDTVFDPAAARDHGVPEGPKFGRLAAGESVTVDGETVTPEMVTTRRTRRLPL